MWPQFLFPLALCLGHWACQEVPYTLVFIKLCSVGPLVKATQGWWVWLGTLTHASVVPQVTQRRVTPAAQAERPAQRANTAARCARAMAAEALPNGTAVDERVEALRKAMQEAGVDAYIVPSEDAHMVGCYELT